MFSAALTCWLMVAQRLEGLSVEGAWSAANLELVRSLSDSRRAGYSSLSPSAGGFGLARQTIPLPMVEAVCDQLFQELRARCVQEAELEVFGLDGSSLSPDGSRAMLDRFPPCENQHGPSHFPTLKFVVAHDLRSGLAVRPEVGAMYGSKARSEQDLSLPVLERLPEGCVVVADRNFGVFSIARAITASSRSCVLRLTDSRLKRLLGTEPKHPGEYKVSWRPTRDDLRANPELSPECCIEGRVVVGDVRFEPSKPPVRLCVFVSGLDLDAQQILEIYGLRWFVETDLRTLKHTLNVECLKSKIPEVLLKEFILGVSAYNLLRSLAVRAASLAGVPPRQVSFSRLCAYVKAYGPRIQAASDPETQEALVREMLLKAAARTNKPRHRPSQPRRVWSRRDKYPARKQEGRN